MFANLKGFISFSKAERNGFLILMGIIIVLITLISTQEYWSSQQLSHYPLPSKMEFYSIDSLLEVKKERDRQEKQYYSQEFSPRKKKKGEWQKPLVLFEFDPNTLDSLGWKELGFSPKQISSILKYRSRGGKFYKKEDVQKLYVVDQYKYEQLEPFIVLETKEQTEDKVFSERKKEDPVEVPLTLEVNEASEMEWQKLKGIGEVLAGRIVKFRNRLGGFCRMEQLLEVYGIKPEVYDGFKHQLTLDENRILRINVNTASFQDLLKHPYLDYEVVKKIKNYWDKNGDFGSIDQLKSLDLMSPETFGKIESYLSIGE